MEGIMIQNKLISRVSRVSRVVSLSIYTWKRLHSNPVIPTNPAFNKANRITISRVAPPFPLENVVKYDRIQENTENLQKKRSEIDYPALRKLAPTNFGNQLLISSTSCSDLESFNHSDLISDIVFSSNSKVCKVGLYPSPILFKTDNPTADMKISGQLSLDSDFVSRIFPISVPSMFQANGILSITVCRSSIPINYINGLTFLKFLPTTVNGFGYIEVYMVFTFNFDLYFLHFFVLHSNTINTTSFKYFEDDRTVLTNDKYFCEVTH